MTIDTVIIGGGFAGVTAARELGVRGRTAVVLEARDRLGGRTYTATHDGHDMELGGTWVHPFQPHVWAEITRYGLDLEDYPVPGGTQAVLSGGRIVDLTEEDFARFLDALAEYSAPGAALFAAPYSEEWGPDPQGYDGRTMRAHLDTLALPPVPRDLLDCMCVLTAFGPLDRSAATEIMRVFALSGASALHYMAAMTSLKLVKGTRALIEAMAGQAKLADFRFNSVVRRVVRSADRVQVELQGGEVLEARSALVTLPMNVLGSVEFQPSLSPVKQAAAQERHIGRGAKIYARVKGDVGNISVFAPEAEIVNWAVTYDHGPDGSWLLLFGADADRLSLADPAGVQTALRRLVPGVEVERVFGWDWATDPYAMGTWCIFQPGQMTRFLPELRRAEGNVFFASGDSAVAWRSFIDGAIESGYRGAREIDAHLRGKACKPESTQEFTQRRAS